LPFLTSQALEAQPDDMNLLETIDGDSTLH
jgi:hypothetical protein